MILVLDLKIKRVGEMIRCSIEKSDLCVENFKTLCKAYLNLLETEDSSHHLIPPPLSNPINIIPPPPPFTPRKEEPIERIKRKPDESKIKNRFAFNEFQGSTSGSMGNCIGELKERFKGIDWKKKRDRIGKIYEKGFLKPLKKGISLNFFYNKPKIIIPEWVIIDLYLRNKNKIETIAKFLNTSTKIITIRLRELSLEIKPSNLYVKENDFNEIPQLIAQ